MLRKILAAACFALAFAAVPVKAQPVKVVATCGVVTPAFATATTSAIVTMDVNGNLCTAASVSASISGFTPGLTFASLTATGSSASVALPAGATVAFQNTGTTTVSCTLGVGSATATAGQVQVPASSTVFMTVGTNTFGACIDETGSASNVVRLAGGAGLGTGFGGGGGGGGGGAITAASGSYASGAFASGSMAAGSHAAGAGVDGWDLTQGAIADANITAGATGSISAKLRAISRDIGTVATNSALPLPAQTGIGNINIGAVTNAGSKYIAVAAGATATVLQTSTGAIGDYLSHCVLYPTAVTTGVVTVFDNTNTAATSAILFPGGTSALSNLAPISIPVGAISTAGAWKVTTGTAISVVCYGKFS